MFSPALASCLGRPPEGAETKAGAEGWRKRVAQEGGHKGGGRNGSWRAGTLTVWSLLAVMNTCASDGCASTVAVVLRVVSGLYVVRVSSC